MPWDELEKVKWPSNCEPKSGFALRTRQGRLFVMHAESHAAADKWIAALRSVGANITMTARQAALAKGEALPEDEDADADAQAGQDSDSEDEGTHAAKPAVAAAAPVEEKKFVHPVVGGVVIKTEVKK